MKSPRASGLAAKIDVPMASACGMACWSWVNRKVFGSIAMVWSKAPAKARVTSPLPAPASMKTFRAGKSSTNPCNNPLRVPLLVGVVEKDLKGALVILALRIEHLNGFRLCHSPCPADCRMVVSNV